ncbi:PREDICTED: N-formyl peptide receptor 2-like isoform X1 [Hipposideros armiger]|uniref:N-formyl peptide receptor 2-like isoform X1 n=2 Tax=Hipposideros armiger TaxID=186990 RepID=A0A8B7QM63_HIPAR|nr:PREDICTED: N-formyl peptide receptor 2-like isoform X1 [Hipposideros armiger]XP_019489272.1 PREDICTED: N-formyl peptide receptor 2-like isoform X1 [Hipposideros armiger]
MPFQPELLHWKPGTGHRTRISAAGVGKMETNFSSPVNAPEEILDASSGYHAIEIYLLVSFGIIFVLGFLGNGLVIWVTGFRMARTVTTLCYLNLALNDFSFTVTLPFLMVLTAMRGQWPFGWFLCKVVFTMGDMNLFGSVFLIAFIALDRCICVLHPVWAQNHRTVTLARIVIIVPWILALVLTFPVFFFVTIESDEKNNTYCLSNTEFFSDNDEMSWKMISTTVAAMGIIQFVIGFIMPMSIIAICYGLIAAKIHKKVMINSSRPLQVLTAVMVSFFLCWFPFQLILFLGRIWIKEIALEGKYSIILLLRVLTTPLAFLNSCLNPILYVFMGQDFRRRLIHSLPASLERALIEDSAETIDTTTKSASPPTVAQLQEM